jgi:hypothetical protein
VEEEEVRRGEEKVERS